MNVRTAGRSVSGIFSTFFFSGCFPVAPGTAGSLAAAVCYALFLHRLHPVPYVVLTAAVFLAGMIASDRFSREIGKKDPGFIVIDEVCGQMIAMAFLAPSLLNMGLAFALFRFFDILKPFPVRNAERLRGGLGIMADDVVAGTMAGLVLRLVLIII